ncbi:xanthine dehydrogenase-like [Cimex lectularius]|uniref:Indole-3-acetaldehyde oxidase n=1 Tax=Cimex lectularius TaxID=79782 RepID=A0A8I6S7Q1_CIMLE|nr:xanthine dehydrogenase-like [Cimex lectularius]
MHRAWRSPGSVCFRLSGHPSQRYSSKMPPQQISYSSLGREVELTINGKSYKVSNDVPADTTLNAFIREYAHLKGTKFMCLEGGCGACIVSVHSVHPTTHHPVFYSVNSCLVPIFACHGWAVTTVEGLGSKYTGYHKIQKRLAAANGTQCGYCTPGMVMNMHSLLEVNPKLTMKDVENSFGGNICRCTGYRPILDAFKSLASDAPGELVQKLADIEDIVCPKTGQNCSGGSCNQKCSSAQSTAIMPPSSLHFELENGSAWYRPLSVKEIMEIFDMIEDKTYRLIAGNTGQGVYRIKEAPEVYIDLNGIPELHGYEVRNDGITLGANISLTEGMDLFYKLAKEQPEKYSYCKTLADHIDLIANVPVRNIGTFAGNISLKHQNEEFPSDLFLFLEMVGATLFIVDRSGVNRTMSLLEYLETDMNKKAIVKINLPVLDHNVYFTLSYKIMPRAQNAHAFVNAGFLMKVDKANGYTVMETPTILFGGINPHFLHATKTEQYLKGKKLLDDQTLKGALQTLESELKPDHVLPDASPAFRTGLALSLFYKFILTLDPSKISERNKSGGPLLERPLSSGIQDFETDRNLWPLNKPIPKTEALIQCSGEAEYTNDIPNVHGQVWGQLVLTDRSNAVVSKIDPSQALKMPGVIAFFSAKDIPGKNTFVQPAPNVLEDERIFVDGRADYAGQAVGVIIANTHTTAINATKKVKITYTDQKPIIMDMRQIINHNMKDRIKEYAKLTPTTQKSDIKYKIKGHWDLKTQYHYTMETQTCVVVPTEDHLEVYPSSQWPAAAQEAISIALNIPEHIIDMRVRRLGGGYGAKLTRNNHVSVVCALAAHLLHRPVRMVLNLETNVEWAGKRFPVFSDYEVGVNSEGEIQYLNSSIYQDDGHGPNDSSIGATIHHIKNVYDASVWKITGYGVKTDSASNTWCRAPGSTEAISLIETIMEHIANVVEKDPVSVRLANMDKEDNPIPQLIEDIKKASHYDERVKEVEQFNKDNRWKKRGISLVPMNYPFDYWGAFYGMVSIFGMDGTVSISHGAIEMGQGVNTKAAQVAAHILGIELELVNVKPTTTLISPNNSSTGGSIGSEAVCYAVKVCCEILNERLEPIKEKLGPQATWKEIVNQAYLDSINLNHTYMFTARDDVKSYAIYGTVVTEVEIDILTGQYHTRRVDLMEDAGQSLSPEVDIGQVEGAFVMGLGYFTCEEAVYESKTGAILTNRTWNYKPPGAKDIPIDFRVSLRKNAPNPFGVLRSKATGEPPFCLSCSVLFSIRNAVESARKDAGQTDEKWFDIEPPFTGEKIWLGGLTKKDMFKL